MNTAIKVLIALMVMVAVVIGTLIIITARLDLNDYRDEITDFLQKSTGRSVVLAGELSHTLYPWLSLETGGIIVGNPSGFDDGAFLSLEGLKIRVKTLPLLRNVLEIDTLKIQGMRLHLVKNGDGRGNWDDLMEPTVTPREKAAAPLAALLLGGIDIRDAALTWTDHHENRTATITDADLQTGELVVGQPVELRASMRLAADRPDIKAAINLNGTIVYQQRGDQLTIRPLAMEADLEGKNIPTGQNRLILTTAMELNRDAGTAELSDINIRLLASTATGGLRIEQLDTASPSFAATLAVRGEDISALFKAAEVEPLASQLSGLSDRSFDIKTAIDADAAGGDINISLFNAHILGANIQAEAHARNRFSGTPAVRARIDAQGPDLPALFGIAGALDARLASVAQQLRAVKDKSFHIKTDFDADLKSGRIDLTTLDINAADLILSGDLQTQRLRSLTPALKGRIDAQGSDLPTLMAAIGVFLEPDNALSVHAGKLAALRQKSFMLAGRFDADLQTGTLSLPTLEAQALGFELAAELAGDNIHRPKVGLKGVLKGGLNGKLRLSHPNPAPILSALDQAGLAQTLQSFVFNTDISGNPARLSLQPLVLNAVLAGDRIADGRAELRVNADTLLDLRTQDLNINRFSISGLGLDIHGRLSAQQYLSDPVFGGELSVAPFNLKTLMRRLNQTPPETADSGAFNTVAITDTAFTGSQKGLEVSQFKATLDDSNIQGSFSARVPEQTEYQFGIAIDRIDADRYLPPEGADSPPVTPETAAAAGKLPLETLRALNLKGDLAIGELMISGATLTQARLSMNAKDGLITLAPVTAMLYDGSYSGGITLDAKGDEPLLSMKTDFANINLQPLLTDLADGANLHGTGNISLAVNSRGGDVHALKRHLSGNGRIDLRAGVLKGMDIPGVLRQIEVLYESKRIGRVDKGDLTRFDSLTGSLNIENGVVANDDLLMTAPGFTVNGKGTLLDLNDASWKYKFIVSVDDAQATLGEQRYNLGGYSLGINCGGRLIEKKCTPDVKTILQALLKGKLKDKVKHIIGDKLPIRIPGLSTEPAPEPKTDPAESNAPPQTRPEDAAEKAVKKLLDKIF